MSCVPRIYLVCLLMGLLSEKAHARWELADLTGSVSLHSHNDYEQKRPLWDALLNHFDSVEADIWLVDGEIVVSHLGWGFRGSLRNLYLNPLQERVNRMGSVFGDGKPFYLWLDIKDSNPRLRQALVSLLDSYRMLSIFTDSSEEMRPVTVILTGNFDSKRRLVEDFPVRKFCRDSNLYRDWDPPADHRWKWYALNWADYIGWDGQGELSAADREKLEQVIRGVHGKRRKLRFYGAPESERLWMTSMIYGVDLIGTDVLDRMRRFIEGPKGLIRFFSMRQ